MKSKNFLNNLLILIPRVKLLVEKSVSIISVIPNPHEDLIQLKGYYSTFSSRLDNYHLTLKNYNLILENYNMKLSKNFFKDDFSLFKKNNRELLTLILTLKTITLQDIKKYANSIINGIKEISNSLLLLNQFLESLILIDKNVTTEIANFKVDILSLDENISNELTEEKKEFNTSINCLLNEFERNILIHNRKVENIAKFKDGNYSLQEEQSNKEVTELTNIASNLSLEKQISNDNNISFVEDVKMDNLSNPVNTPSNNSFDSPKRSINK